LVEPGIRHRGVAFREMKVHKVSAAHNTDNPASGKVMSKAGMVKEGVIRDMIRNSKKQYKDCAVYGILREEYMYQSQVGMNSD
jgi:[ribosomal protein S5]-alanine N-acetyltransferase